MKKFESQGIFYGVGVGPGDPELLTVKAINTIKNSDIIIAPKTEKKDDSLALSIAKPYLNENTEVICQTFPMIKNFEDSPSVFEEIKNNILSFLNAGKNVTFLTLGDPMFYSTYVYIFRLLKDMNVKIVTVPGVPSFLAISSYINKPLVYGDDILTVIPATADSKKILDALNCSDVAVLMKVYKNFDAIVDMLKIKDMAEESVLVSRCGLNDEKIITNIEEHKSEKINYLSTILTRRKKEFLSAY